MKTSTQIITGLTCIATALAFIINAEMATAILAAAGVLFIAVKDYSAPHVIGSGLVA
ncbi:MAG: hypothetical protein KBF26_06355 [Opitutaceae bacterium]|nr:hypothetical protein [Opitutaceae bacterium]